MDSETFAEIVDRQLQICKDVLVDKAREYAFDDDRLHNFKVAASLQNETLIESLLGMLAKHTVSVFDMGRDAMAYDMDIWNEKITDHLNYLILLRAALEEPRSDFVGEFSFGQMDVVDYGSSTNASSETGAWVPIVEHLTNEDLDSIEDQIPVNLDQDLSVIQGRINSLVQQRVNIATESDSQIAVLDGRISYLNEELTQRRKSLSPKEKFRLKTKALDSLKNPIGRNNTVVLNSENKND